MWSGLNGRGLRGHDLAVLLRRRILRARLQALQHFIARAIGHQSTALDNQYAVSDLQHRSPMGNKHRGDAAGRRI